MSVISSTWGFVKRHKGKIILLTGAVGGFMYLNKFLSSVERNWEKSASKDFVAEVRKKETHFENSVQTCNSTCASLAPKVLEILDTLLDPRPLLSAMQKDKTNIGLWKEMSVLIFTRAVAEVYCLCHFVCYLRVQLLVIAGYIYVDSIASESMAGSSLGSAGSSNRLNMTPISQSIQLKYLSLLNAFYEDGIHEILKPVTDAVKNALTDVSLKDKLSSKDLETIFDQVRMRMNFSIGGTEASRFLITAEKIKQLTETTNGPSTSSSSSTLSDSSNVRLTEKESKVLQNLMNETQDLLEHEDFNRTLNSSIEVGFNHMLDLLVTCFVNKSSNHDVGSNGMVHVSSNGDACGSGSDSANGTSSGGIMMNSMTSSTSSSIMTSSQVSTSSPFLNPNNVSVPLAKLLPSMRHVLYERKSHEEKQSLLRHILCLDILNCYSANVYEAFCDPRNRKY